MENNKNNLSRRFLCLYGFGASLGLLVTSCASVSTPREAYLTSSSPSSSGVLGSFWDNRNYQGKLEYWEFQAVGKFIPGTREHRAWGVPVPRPYQSSNEYIVSNVWSALGFWVSALNYLLLTGEAEPLKVIDPELKTARPDMVKLYEDETGWVISQHLSPMESPLKLELLDPKPVETPEGSKNYLWRARLSIDASASVFYADTKDSRPLADVLGLQSGEVQLQIAYVEGKWRSETAYDVVYQVS